MNRRNIRILIAYDGTPFKGWQRQRNGLSIQGILEEKLAIITREQIKVNGAGRTDAGVHAEGMVANFTTCAALPAQAFFKALNSMLPKAIRILSTDEVAADFHARYTAKGKSYRYDFFTGSILHPTERLYRTHFPCRSFVVENMLPCLQELLGRHDFQSFEAVGSRDRSKTTGRGAVRTLYRAECCQTPQQPEHFSFYFSGDGFLRHMIRNLVGTLFLVGAHRLNPAAFTTIVAAKDRQLAGPTAPAQGLFLEQVHY